MLGGLRRLRGGLGRWLSGHDGIEMSSGQGENFLDRADCGKTSLSFRSCVMFLAVLDQSRVMGTRFTFGPYLNMLSPVMLLCSDS